MTEERIGDRLKRLMKETNLSQRELAKRSGVDREHINQIVNYKTKSMMLRTAERLAKGMGISPCRFFSDGYQESTEVIIEGLIDYLKSFK